MENKKFLDLLYNIKKALEYSLKSINLVIDDYERNKVDYSEYIELEHVNNQINLIRAIMHNPKYLSEMNKKIIPLYKDKSEESEKFLKSLKD